MIRPFYIYNFLLIMVFVNSEKLCYDEQFKNGSPSVFDSQCSNKLYKVFKIKRYNDSPITQPSDSSGYFLTNDEMANFNCQTHNGYLKVESKTRGELKFYVENYAAKSSCNLQIVKENSIQQKTFIFPLNPAGWKILEFPIENFLGNLQIQIVCANMNDMIFAIDYIKLLSDDDDNCAVMLTTTSTTSSTTTSTTISTSLAPSSISTSSTPATISTTSPPVLPEITPPNIKDEEIWMPIAIFLLSLLFIALCYSLVITYVFKTSMSKIILKSSDNVESSGNNSSASSTLPLPRLKLHRSISYDGKVILNIRGHKNDP